MEWLVYTRTHVRREGRTICTVIRCVFLLMRTLSVIGLASLQDGGVSSVRSLGITGVYCPLRFCRRLAIRALLCLEDCKGNKYSFRLGIAPLWAPSGITECDYYIIAFQCCVLINNVTIRMYQYMYWCTHTAPGCLPQCVLQEEGWVTCSSFLHLLNRLN